jgi:hypothetical protein
LGVDEPMKLATRGLGVIARVHLLVETVVATRSNASAAGPAFAYSWFCQPRTAASTFRWALPFCLPTRAMGAAAPAAKVVGRLPRD